MVFFRADNIQIAISYIKKIFSLSLFEATISFPLSIGLIVISFITVEWIQRNKLHALDLDSIRLIRPIRWVIYFIIFIMILQFNGGQQEFIYFQF